MDASRESTRVDICDIRSKSWVDISSNLASSWPSKVSTKAVSSCGLEMSSGFVVGPTRNAACEGFGDGCFDGVGDALGGTLSGAGVPDIFRR